MRYLPFIRLIAILNPFFYFGYLLYVQAQLRNYPPTDTYCYVLAASALISIICIFLLLKRFVPNTRRALWLTLGVVVLALLITRIITWQFDR